MHDWIKSNNRRESGFVLVCGAAEAASVAPGAHQWAIMFPTTSRIPPRVYESLVGSFYQVLVNQRPDDSTQLWVFGIGTRNTGRREPHGFQIHLLV